MIGSHQMKATPRRIAAILAGCGIIAAGVLGAAPANARPVYGTTYTVVNSSYVGNYVNTSDLIARCYASGGSCTITAGKTATINIDLALGYSRAGVAGNLGISSSSSTSLSIGCTSPKLAAGKAWSAYPVGRYYTYKIQKMTTAPSGTTFSTSGWLHAYSPYSNQISCR